MRADESSVVRELPRLGELPAFVWPPKHERNVAVGLDGWARDVQDKDASVARLQDPRGHAQVLRRRTALVLELNELKSSGLS